GSWNSLVLPERQADQLQQPPGFLVGLRGGHNRHVHPPRLVDLHVVDLREDDLVAQAERVVAAPVEAARRNAAEVAHARQGNRNEPVEELVHPLAAQRHHHADRHALAEPELRDRLLRARDGRLLARDLRQLLGAGLDDLRVLRPFAEPHVDHDLRDLGHRHHVLVAEFLAQRRDHLGDVAFSEAAHRSTTPLHLTQYRTRRPSSSSRRPTRAGCPHSGQTSCTFEIASGASRSTIPPLMLRCGFGLVCRLTTLTPSTTTRPFAGSTLSTRPRLPRSRPAMTRTLS